MREEVEEEEEEREKKKLVAIDLLSRQ